MVYRELSNCTLNKDWRFTGQGGVAEEKGALTQSAGSSHYNLRNQ